MTTLASYAQFDLRRFSAGVGLGASLLGVGVGVHLTVLKFKMVYAPCLSPTGGCQVGSLSCGAALESSLSTLLGLPISLWGSAFYLATAVLSASLLVRRAFGGAAAHILLLFAWVSALVSVVLAAYTAIVLRSPCSASRSMRSAGCCCGRPGRPASPPTRLRRATASCGRAAPRTSCTAHSSPCSYSWRLHPIGFQVDAGLAALDALDQADALEHGR